jgi:signal transduction histidine kinase
MRRSLVGSGLVLIAALGISSVVMVIAGGGHAVVVTAEILVPIGVLALLVAQAAASGWLGPTTLHRRFGLGLGLALGQLLAALVIGAAVMFVSDHDALATIGLLVFAALIAARAAQLLSSGVERDIRNVRDGLQAVQRGDRQARVTASSSTELSDLATAANRMIGTLQSEERQRDAADNARRQVIAAVSHDLRTPLTSLRLLTQALDDDLVDAATARRYVQTMGTNVQTLSVLIDDLFELSRLDAGDFAWSTEAVALSELVRDTITSMSPAADAKCVSLGASIAPDLAPARANPDKLQRVLCNLLQNAIHHTPADGSVLVSAQAAEDTMEIEVADTGAGIDAQDAQRVFEPFYRAGSDASRSEAGSGLGLAIARAIVEAHGGRIWLAEAPHGTRVRFTLPLATG